MLEQIVKKKRQNLPDRLDAEALRALIFRVCRREEYVRKFSFEQTGAEHDMDFYRMYDRGSQIVIEANNTISAATALNYYLTEKCRAYFGPITENMSLPKVPPAVGENVCQTSQFVYRYFMNYCTFTYTMLFAGWNEYERLIDWMALSGVNLALNIVGHEIVERDMLRELGYPNVSEYLAGPAYLPWQWMGNMTGFLGNLPDWWYEKQKALSQKINNRFRELGIGIMMPGFFGMVPTDFSKYFPESKPADQGIWCYAFQRQPLLLPDDPMFDHVADLFYQKTKEHFGEIHYFSGDPFHEGGKTDGIDMTGFTKAVAEKMRKHSKNGVWFLQGWQTNPKQEILQGFSQDEVLVGFLSADKLTEEFDGYHGYPWLYMCTPNFGGTRKQDGNIKAFLKEPEKLLKEPEKRLCGIGMTMEAIEMDEPVFDAFSKTAVHSLPMEEDVFLCSCVSSRYGYLNENLKETYRLIFDQIYTITAENTYRGRESILCARPALHADTVSYWSAVPEWYGADILRTITKRLLKEYEQLKDCACYRLDLMDYARQLIAETGRGYLDGFRCGYEEKNLEKFEYYVEKFLSLFEIDNRLMGTNPRTRLDVWVKRAEDYSEDEEYRKNFRMNAKNILLLWASKEGASELRDYAYREWNGMMPYYQKRWKLYFEELRKSFGTTPTDLIDWVQLDYEFAAAECTEEPKPEDLGELVREILKITA